MKTRIAVVVAACALLASCRPIAVTDWDHTEEQTYEWVSSLYLYFDRQTFTFNSTLTQDLMNVSTWANFDSILDIYLDDGGAAFLTEFDASALPTSGGGGFGGDGFQSDYGAYLETQFREDITYMTQQRPEAFEPGACFVMTFEVVGFSPSDLEDAFTNSWFTGANCAPGASLFPPR